MAEEAKRDKAGATKKWVRELADFINGNKSKVVKVTWD